MASEAFDLGYGVTVRKTCSVGWAAYPWCRSAFEAICAEESIALADAALYRAKAMGRNLGVGIVANDAAGRTPDKITLTALQEAKSPITRVIKSECPAPGGAADGELEATQPHPISDPSL